MFTYHICILCENTMPYIHRIIENEKAMINHEKILIGNSTNNATNQLLFIIYYTQRATYKRMA